METFGLETMSVITVICYLIGTAAKLLPKVDDRVIPVICGASGGLLGVAAFYLQVAEVAAKDPMTAAAVGILSGLAATGANQIAKQLTK